MQIPTLQRHGEVSSEIGVYPLSLDPFLSSFFYASFLFFLFLFFSPYSPGCTLLSRANVRYFPRFLPVVAARFGEGFVGGIQQPQRRFCHLRFHLYLNRYPFHGRSRHARRGRDGRLINVDLSPVNHGVELGQRSQEGPQFRPCWTGLAVSRAGGSQESW